MDGNIIKFAASDTEFISMNKRSKATPLNPGNAIIRWQFLEILMRLAFRRYEDSKYFHITYFIAKEASSKPEAIRMLYENNLKPYYFEQLDTQKWRSERYWNEKVDNLLKAHYPLFNYIFKNYGC